MIKRLTLILLCIVVSLSLTTPFNAPKVEARGMNLSQGKSYSYSYPNNPSTLFPDTDGKELTDGVMGSEPYYNPEWQGRSFDSDNSFYFTIFLESAANIEETSIHFIEAIDSSVFLPHKVEFYYSLDGTTYDLLGDGIAQPAINGITTY